MLHFFRKIRRELLAESKFFRYLKYGIGEIILVVIGILIAIQLDNWNEDRIAAEKTKVLFKQVSEELVQNIKNIDRNLNDMIRKDSLFFKVLIKGVEYEDYKTSPGLFTFPFIYNRASLSGDDFKVLLEYKDNLTKHQDSILLELKDLYGKRKKIVDLDDETQHNTQMDIRDEWRNEQEWFSNLFEGGMTDEMIQYALTDPFYRNDLHEMRFREYWRTMGLLWFRTKALDLYEEITEMLKIEKDTLLVFDTTNFEQIKGVYKFGDEKVQIRGKNKLRAYFFDNDSLIQEWNIHSYSKTYLISYGEEKWHNILSKIEFGNNGEILGFSNFGDDTLVNGKRILWKKIE